jgi:hypothetical protein
LQPVHFDALPVDPLVSFQAVKIQLPVDFIPELDRIEAFYDLHLQELVPFTFGEGETPQAVREKTRTVNRCN